MIVTLKFLHLFSLLLGGAAAGGNTVLGELVARSGAPPQPLVANAMGILMKIGLLGVVLLWLTGLPLAFQIYGDLNLGSIFVIKLILASLALGFALAMNIHAANSRKNGTPPNARLLRGLGRATGVSVVIILALSADIFATSL